MSSTGERRLLEAIDLETSKMPKREHKPTMKGLEFQSHLDAQHLSRLYKKLSQVMSRANELIRNREISPDEVQPIYTEWLGIYQEFMNVFDNAKITDRTVCDTNETRMNDLGRFKDSMELYFLSYRDEDRHYSASQVSRGSGSTTVSKQRLLEIERNAQLAADLSTLKERQELEAAEFELKQKIEENRLRTSLIASESRNQALKELDIMSNSSVKSFKEHDKHSVIRPVESSKDQNPFDMKKLCELISSKDDLPSKEPSVFTGNSFEFPLWIKSFEALVEDKRPKAKDRLYYLGIYTKGEPYHAIEGYLLLGSSEAYQEAKDTLMDRYGNPLIVAEAFKRKLHNWSSLKHSSGAELRKFVDFLKSCRSSMDILRSFLPLDSIQENEKILSKLPNHIVNRWNREVDIVIHDQRKPFPSFSKFVDFLSREIRLVNSVLVTKLEDTASPKPQNRQLRQDQAAHSFSSGAQELSATSGPGSQQAAASGIGRAKCVVCKESHFIDMCPQFKGMSLSDRQNAMKAHALCYGCMMYGHRKQNCRNRKTCDQCKRQHPTLLHDDNWQRMSQNTNNNVNNVDTPPSVEISSNCLNCSENSCSPEYHSLIVPVNIFHQADPSNVISVYAMIDEQSDACFITNSVLNSLKSPATSVEVKLSTVLAEQVIKCNKVSGLIVSGMTEPTEIELPSCYTRDSIPVKESQIPHPNNVAKWPHLSDVAQYLMPYDRSMPVGLLIGINCVRATRPREVISGQEDDPYAVRTALGWGVIGAFNECKNKPHSSNVQTRDSRNAHFVFRTQVSEISPAQVYRMFNMDFQERTSAAKMSLDDTRFLNIAKDGIRYKDGHFMLPLPLKDETMLPDNKPLAVKRLYSLKKRMSLDSKFKYDYVKFMDDLQDKGYAEKVPSDDISISGNTWYIPHHAVYHKMKQKIRVVFDCSAEYQGQSLNDHLLPGPDMINNLTGVLVRFRQERIAFTCDIEAMFHQVLVNKEHRNLLRFLWWDNPNQDGDPIDYRMTSHLFGARSSPGCVNFALKTTADMFESVCGPEAAGFVRNNFYVDDGLKSVHDQQTAIQLIKDAQQLCQMGGFHLHKIVANDKEVLKSISPEDRAKDIQEIDLGSDDLPIERTLGVQWCVQSDNFQFRVDLCDCPLTRRGILSTISSIFDPLGLVCPSVLIGKRILQELCKDNADWDDPINDNVRARWERWRTEIHLLSSLEIPRCYKPQHFGDIHSVELHHFSDASLDGLGQCSYLRLKDKDGHISTSLVMGKARVVPSKPITVPRLELTAAVISVKVSEFLTKELDYDIASEYFWTDSKVTLGYINNDAKRFHIYVANRVQEIRDHTSPSDWRHIGTKENPADMASRGLNAAELTDNDAWWHGPQFLQTNTELMPMNDIPEPAINDPEVRNVTVMTTNVHENKCDDNFLSRLSHISSWNSAKRAIALCKRFVKLLKEHKHKPKQPINIQNLKKGSLCYKPITVQEIQDAEKTILSAVQKEAFPVEVKFLHNVNKENIKDRQVAHHRNQTLKRTSTLYRLDPYISVDGLIRVGGRLKRANLPKEITNPVIIPKQGHISKLIITHYHEQCGHSGRGMTINALRSNGFWIIASTSVVTSYIWNCVICRKLRRKPQGQKMADLPKDRLEPAPPFSYSAVDCFGPFYIKEGRKEIKRYGVLFTCLNSRAIHIEVAASMTTDSFLNAYRRFICRRGPIRLLRSDQGSNFIGAKGEQAASMAEMDHKRIQSELLQNDCDWINFEMNAPHASHMGGVWERMIRCARNALSALLIAHSDKLDDELLRTFLVEAESIVNSRPLSYIDTKSPDSPVPLTPQQILTLKTKAVMPPPGNFVRQDLYCHRRWRRVQYLANEFWTRWRLEFLPTLQERKKWIRTQRDVSVDDIVLLVDEMLPRNKWPLGRVIDIHKDQDGLVRRVKVMTSQSVYERPVHKLVILLEHNEV